MWTKDQRAAEHIKGVLTRSGVGMAGDDEMQEYLRDAKQRIPMKYHGKCEWDFDSDGEDENSAPLSEEEKVDRTRWHCDNLCLQCW